MDKQMEELVVTVSEYINRLIEGIMETAELFQSYEENKGIAFICEISEGIEWITDALVTINKLSEKKIIEMNNKLNEVVAALENEDYILVGDLLQYELLPVIEEINNNLL